MMVIGLLAVTLIPMNEPEVSQRKGFTVPVTGFAAERESVLVVISSLLVPTLLPMDEPEVGQRAGFGGLVVDVVGGVLDMGVESQRAEVEVAFRADFLPFIYSAHLLRADQNGLFRRFSTLEIDGARNFNGLEMISDSPVPLIASTFSWVVCERWAEHDGSDHTIIVGRLLESSHPKENSVPLVWFVGWSCYPESVNNRPDFSPVI